MNTLFPLFKLEVRNIFFLGLLFLAISAPSSSETLEMARTACRNKDYKMAIEILDRLAKQGDSNAQYALGRLYRDSENGIQNDTKAISYLTISSNSGNASASYLLAKSYESGIGVRASPEKAASLFKKAFQQGCIIAAENIGNMYRDGTGLPKDYREAEKFFLICARLGYVNAIAALGQLYFHNLREFDKAQKWIRISAEENNNGYMQLLLAKQYYFGLGVSKDYSEAYYWANIAAATGCGILGHDPFSYGFIEFREKAEKALNEREILAVQKRCREFFNKHKGEHVSFEEAIEDVKKKIEQNRIDW